MFEREEPRIELAVEILLKETADMTPIRAAYHVCYLLELIPKETAEQIKDEYAKRRGE